MSIRLSDIPDIEPTIKTKGIRLSDIPDEQPKFTGKPIQPISALLGISPEELSQKGSWVKGGLLQTAEDIYREGISPIMSGGSTFAAGIPKMIAKAQGKEAGEITFPEQTSIPGKLLRGISEITGFTAGTPSRVTTFVGKTIPKILPKVLPKFAGRILTGAGAGAAGMATAGDTLKNRKEMAKWGAILGGAIPIVEAGGNFAKGVVTKSGRWLSKNIGGITDATVNTIKRLGANRVFDPLKAKADYISQNIAPKIYDKFVEFENRANSAYRQAIKSAPEGKQINIKPAIQETGKRLKSLGLITETGNLTELGQSEIARDSVYGKLLDFYKSADAISGVKKLQNVPLTQSQIIKASKAMNETLVNKEQFTFLRDKLNSLYKNKPSDIDVSKVVNEFYQAGENSGMKGLQQARKLQRTLFDIEDRIDVNKITRDLVKAKNPQWSKVIQKDYQSLVDKGVLNKQDYQNFFDDLMAHFANIDFELVSETPGVGGGFYPSRAGFLRKGIAGTAKQYYKNVAPQTEKLGKFTGGILQKGKQLIEKLQK